MKRTILIAAGVIVFLLSYQNCSNVNLLENELALASCEDTSAGKPSHIQLSSDPGNPSQTINIFIEELHNGNFFQSQRKYNWTHEYTVNGQVTTTSYDAVTGFSIPHFDPAAAVCMKHRISASIQLCGELYRLPDYVYKNSHCEDSPVVPPPNDPQPPPGDGEADHCQVSKEELIGQDRRLFQPDGFTPTFLEWSQIFRGCSDENGGVECRYPNTPGVLTPVGSWSLVPELSGPQRYVQSPGINNKYIVIPIVAEPPPFGIIWITPQARPAIGYSPARGVSGVIAVTLSTCPGDFRLRNSYLYEDNSTATDPTNKYACRIAGGSEHGFRLGPDAQCPVVVGKKYYINILFQDIRDGTIDPGRSTCVDQVNHKCEFSFTTN